MFSLKVLRTIEKSIKFLERTKLFPFSWDDKNNTLTRKLSKDKIRTLWINIFLLHYLGYMFHNLYNFYRTFYSKSGQVPMDITWVGLCAGGHYISFEGLLNANLKQQEMVTHFRQMMLFEKRQKTLEIPDATKRWKFRNKLAICICRGHVISCLTLAFTAPFLYYFKARGPQYLYSSWSGDETSIYALFFAYEFFAKSMNASALFLSQAWFLFSVAYLTFGISNLRRSKDPLRKKVAYFRGLHLLNDAHNRCYLVTLLPFRFAFYGQFLVGCSFVLIHLRSEVSLMEQVIMSEIVAAFIVAPFLYLHISGKVLRDSRQLRDVLFKDACSVWTSKAENKALQKDIKSLKPLGIRVGSIRTISYAALNAFFITVCSVLTTMLVAVKEP